jgi:hypothetical protein
MDQAVVGQFRMRDGNALPTRKAPILVSALPYSLN